MAARPETFNPGTDPLLPVTARVHRRRREIPGTVTLDLEMDQPAAAPIFRPGQFNMLYAFGVGEIPVSISGDARGKRPLLHTIRAVGPVSSALTALKTGEALGIRGPYGAGWPVQEARGADVIVIAGGLGLAPLRPVLYELFRKRRNFGHIQLFYGTRSPAEVLYVHELERWRSKLDVGLEVTVDHATGPWHGHVGVVTTLIETKIAKPGNTIAMVCGPEVMMRFTIAGLVDAGLPPERIWLSMERNMKCAVGHCGHCQFGPTFICRDGPVFRYDRIKSLLALREI